MHWHKDPSLLTTKNTPVFQFNTYEPLKLLSPKTKQGMLPAVQELTCFKVFFLSKAFMTLGGGSSSHLGKALISIMWFKYLSFTAPLSSTEGMKQASDCCQTTLAKVAEGLIFKVPPFTEGARLTLVLP